MEKYNNECLDDNDPFFEACKVGDTELVRAYLNQGGSAFAGSPNRPHLACIALQNGMIPIVEAMLNADLNVNDEVNRFHERPLSYGVSRSHRPLIEFLLAQGGDVNKKNTNGTSIFAGACAKSPLNIVKLLFDAGGKFGVETPLEERRFNGRPLKTILRTWYFYSIMGQKSMKRTMPAQHL